MSYYFSNYKDCFPLLVPLRALTSHSDTTMSLFNTLKLNLFFENGSLEYYN